MTEARAEMTEAELIDLVDHYFPTDAPDTSDFAILARALRARLVAGDVPSRDEILVKFKEWNATGESSEIRAGWMRAWLLERALKEA